MAKLKQRPQNFAQNFAILTQKRQISYLDSDDGDITDDETIASPLKPPKKHVDYTFLLVPCHLTVYVEIR